MVISLGVVNVVSMSPDSGDMVEKGKPQERNPCPAYREVQLPDSAGRVMQGIVLNIPGISLPGITG